jgi:membrane carboxypeptidase/penicillin-binding protein
MTLRGIFSTTAADSTGTIDCTRLPLDNAILEYRGLPMKWFGRLIELASYPLYRAEWNQLKQQIEAYRNSFLESYASCNCRPFVVALILAEDIRYHDHGGVDPIAVARALWQTIVMGRPQGGSTIEQQLVRVLTRDYRKSMRRKLKEIVFAVRLHSELDKDLVPIAYLTVAYCGWRMNGLRQAANRLKIDLKSPTSQDAAAIVARIRYPEPRNPNPTTANKIQTRFRYIQQEMKRRPHLLA